MFGRSITLFRVLGFPIRLNASWLVLAVLVSWSLADGYFPQVLPGRGVDLYWSLGVVGMAGLVISLVLHELSHASVARLRGLQIDGITLFIFGGVAEMRSEPPTPRIEGEVAAAGPLMSFALAGLFALLTTLVGGNGALGVLFDYLSTLNLILAVFNLVPGFPLDGGRLFRAALWAKSGDLIGATRRATQVGQGFGWLLITLGAALVLSGGGVGGLWWILIGLFLNGAAKQSYEQLLVHSAFAALPVERLLSHPPIVVAADLPLDRFVEDFAYRHHFSLFPVVDRGRLIGTIRTRRVADVPRGQWPHHTIGELVQPLTPDDLARPHESAETALQRMQRNGRGQILVVDGDRLLGVLTLQDLLEHLAIRRMLDRSV